jgi:hypothetical protein
MELAWIEDFLALSSTLNFTRAASMRNLTQPIFSRRVRNLELWMRAILVARVADFDRWPSWQHGLPREAVSRSNHVIMNDAGH